MLATVDRSDPDSVQRYEKIVHLRQDMRRQRASILAIANVGDTTIADLADHTIFVAEMREPLLAICEAIPCNSSPIGWRSTTELTSTIHAT